MADGSDDDVRVPTPWETLLRWSGAPRGYQLTRTLIFRLLGFVYVFAFLGIVQQGPALLGSHGLTPIGDVRRTDARGRRDVLGRADRVHARGASDTAHPDVGVDRARDLAVAVACGYTNMPMLLVLWVIYGSFERVGQLWFSFGWEIQILETTLIAAVLAHPWDPRPLAARPPPTTPIVLMRWLVFRIMLGAGLIKLRGGVVLDAPDVPRLPLRDPAAAESAVAAVPLTRRTGSMRSAFCTTTSSRSSRRSSCSARAGCA